MIELSSSSAARKALPNGIQESLPLRQDSSKIQLLRSHIPKGLGTFKSEFSGMRL